MILFLFPNLIQLSSLNLSSTLKFLKIDKQLNKETKSYWQSMMLETSIRIFTLKRKRSRKGTIMFVL